MTCCTAEDVHLQIYAQKVWHLLMDSGSDLRQWPPRSTSRSRAVSPLMPSGIVPNCSVSHANQPFAQLQLAQPTYPLVCELYVQMVAAMTMGNQAHQCAPRYHVIECAKLQGGQVAATQKCPRKARIDWVLHGLTDFTGSHPTLTPISSRSRQERTASNSLIDAVIQSNEPCDMQFKVCPQRHLCSPGAMESAPVSTR